MIDDPYRVLGIAPGATPEEIKRAYRKKAKQYHPDLHPDDPEATRRMNEVNEAYDMLSNPEKYAARRAQARRQGGQTNRQQQGGGAYQGPGGWASDFGGFSFEDIFGFGFEDWTGAGTMRPEAQAGDSPEVQRAIFAINNRTFQEALRILTHIPSTGRNARWHYLSALAHHGLGNTVSAADHITRAVQLDPNNRLYHQLLQQFRQAGQRYEQNARGHHVEVVDLNRLCLSCCAAQLMCSFCRCC